MAIFYKPQDGWLADVIPFYWQGQYHLFYLKDYRNVEVFGEGTPWFHLTTCDFVSFTDHGEVLPRGTREEQDLYVFTGSVIEHDGQFHIFYTGHNPHFEKEDKPVQAVMHAVSDDLFTWCKVPADTFFAPTDRYEPHDWRDPFVFWNEEAGEYWMLLAARLKSGPPRRRGCIALCASHDLQHWQVREPFWAPGLYYTHECPDLFRIGEWWYLVFSEFSEACVTRYRMSRSLAGPWLVPPNHDDAFDGRAFYAAKTTSNSGISSVTGANRYLFGWNPTREGNKDYQRWQWGGNLVVHAIHQDVDGSLAVAVPETVKQAFHASIPVSFTSGLGNYLAQSNRVTMESFDRFSCASAGTLPDTCLIRATMVFTEGTRSCGLMLRISEDFELGYYVRFEPARQRLVFDAWPRAGDMPFMHELERPVPLQAGQPVELNVFIDSTVCEVYACGKVALSTRLYDHVQGNWGVFVSDGQVEFSDVSLLIPK